MAVVGATVDKGGAKAGEALSKATSFGGMAVDGGGAETVEGAFWTAVGGVSWVGGTLDTTEVLTGADWAGIWVKF